MIRVARPPKDLASFIGRKWLEALTGQSQTLSGVLDLAFLLLAADPDLPNARIIAVSSNLVIVDAGPGGTITLNLSDTAVTPGAYNMVTVDQKGRVSSGSLVAYAEINTANVFTQPQSVPDSPYAVGWDGSLTIPTKNAVYDKIEAVLAAAAENAQDAVGAMINSTLFYTDATPVMGINLSSANTWLVDQSVPDEVYGVGWNGSVEVPTKNAIYDKLEATLASGVYTPTRSAEANLDSNVTMTEAQYMRVGSTVNVSGRFTANPSLTATATSFEITLPIASNLGAIEDLAGTAFCGSIVGQGAEVNGVVANDTAQVKWISGDVTSQVWSYNFTYQII